MVALGRHNLNGIQYKNRLNNRGVNTLLMLLVMSILILLSQGYLILDSLNSMKNSRYSQTLEVRNRLLTDLESILIAELAVRNSRFDVNSSLYQCLYADPSPCSELQTYDMVLFSPSPFLIYSGGAWPTPPNGFPMIAGGRTTHPVFYTNSAGICPGATAVSNACPLQAIVFFRPVCGGTIFIPEPMAVPGVCPGRATGVEIMIGVGIYNGSILKYSGVPSVAGDTRMYRIRALSLLN